MTFFLCKISLYFAWTMEKDYRLNVAIAAKGSALVLGYYVNGCIYLPSYTHCGLHGLRLVQNISRNLNACSSVLHFF